MIPCTSFADNTESPQLFSHLYEGDIKLTERQRLNDLVFGDPDGSPSRAATNVDKIKWPNAVIPYEFDCSVGEFVKIYTAVSRKVVGKVHATIPKGIVGGFEFTVLQRNLKKWHERPWTYV